MICTKDEMFAELKLNTEVVELASGKKVIVSEISAPDYSKLWEIEGVTTGESGEVDKDGNKTVSVDMGKFTPALLAYTIVDENGERIFTDEDIPKLAKSASGPFLKIAKVAKRLNGLLGDEGNVSEPTQNGSPSGE
jgi:hypothetical protein